MHNSEYKLISNTHKMTLSVFTEVVRLLKEQEQKVDAAYDSGVDLINFTDAYSAIIAHLIGSIYGKEGKETFEWWCYDKEWGTRKDIKMTNADGIVVCETIEDLHGYLENYIVYDYELPTKKSLEEMQKAVEQMLSHK